MSWSLQPESHQSQIRDFDRVQKLFAASMSVQVVKILVERCHPRGCCQVFFEGSSAASSPFAAFDDDTLYL
jgi:hypothetical protein